MNVIFSRQAEDLVGERGGRLYVWLDRQRCCQGATFLLTASGPPAGHTFRPVSGNHGFELYLDHGPQQPPDEIHLDVRGWRRKRVEAYWNGCVFVT